MIIGFLLIEGIQVSDVSICVAVYNVEKYLPQCIDSILNQSFRDIEVIMVDDGSTDSSGRICDEFACRDARIRVIHQSNGGLSAARNAGIFYSQSDYIAFVDGDDYIDSRFVEDIYKEIKQNDADIACAGYWSVFDSGEKIAKHFVSGRSVLTGSSQLKALICDDSISVTTWGKIYKKELFKNINFPEKRLHEDVFTTHLILARSRKCVVANKALYYYRKRDSSIVSQTFKKEHLDSVLGAKERANYIAFHYPEMLSSANAKVGWAASSVFRKMCKSNCWDVSIANYLHDVAKDTWISVFKNAHSSMLNKIFLILLAISSNVAKYVARLDK